VTADTLQVRPSWVLRLIVVTALVGVGSGISGLLVSLALHGIEHLAYGYSSGTFLDGVLSSSPERRVIALLIAGLIGAVGWWALRRFGRPSFPSNKASTARGCPRCRP